MKRTTTDVLKCALYDLDDADDFIQDYNATYDATNYIRSAKEKISKVIEELENKEETK